MTLRNVRGKEGRRLHTVTALTPTGRITVDQSLLYALFLIGLEGGQTRGLNCSDILEQRECVGSLDLCSVLI